jgi:hypothetical protein
MTKYTIPLAIVLGMVACKSNDGEYPTSKESRTAVVTTSDGRTVAYDVVRIDSCQYIIAYGDGSAVSASITHKGDCDNPIHKH